MKELKQGIFELKYLENAPLMLVAYPHASGFRDSGDIIRLGEFHDKLRGTKGGCNSRETT